MKNSKTKKNYCQGIRTWRIEYSGYDSQYFGDVYIKSNTLNTKGQNCNPDNHIHVILSSTNKPVTLDKVTFSIKYIKNILKRKFT